ncbi:MAG TPA: DUF1697 domain-containing protein [Acidimicrobiales bacterium]|nr:DUF1697 domain-containing protein [Acidimicrobiales bacterium]
MTTTTYVAMLRGINVSGRNRLPMESLRSLVTAAGGEEVRTYIQSGNAVFRSRAKVSGIVAFLEDALVDLLGTKVPVLVRSKSELGAVITTNPFVRRGVEATTLHVTFLAEVPSPADVKAAQAKAVDADEFLVVGRDVFLRCPDGYGKTKLTNTFFEKKLGSDTTTRNWKTVNTLAEMARR